MTKELEPRYLTAKQAAGWLNIGRRTFDDLVRKGALPEPIRLSERLIRWDREELAKALKEPKDGE